MRRVLKIWLLLLLAMPVAVLSWSQEQPVASSSSSSRQWHETQREPVGRALNDPRATDGVEIFGTSGAIMVRTPRRVQVRVFTILGQSVSQSTIGPGTYELRLPTRGIYLVKVGNVTQKVVL